MIAIAACSILPPMRTSAMSGVLALLLLLQVPSEAATTLIDSGDTWKYWDRGSLDGSPSWNTGGFGDGGWSSGPSELGYGDGDEATVIGFGGNPQSVHPTSYFRKSFQVSSIPSHLVVEYVRDDGVILYLNGTEIVRENLKDGDVFFSNKSLGSVITPFEGEFVRVAVDPNLLQVGTNLLAAEVHQDRTSGSDLSFDLRLVGSSTPFAPAITRGPYLQKTTESDATIRWRTDLAAESVVRFGLGPNALIGMATSPGLTTEHEVTVSGAPPNTKLFYSVGTNTSTLAGADSDHFFRTHPVAGVRRPLRLWVVGDSGLYNTHSQEVADAYHGLTGKRTTDGLLLLGDNAYLKGTDLEHRYGLFEKFGVFMRQTTAWPSFGNHDALASNSSTQSGPYYDIFTLPTAGESGGLPSNTEAYYAFDLANVHFVILDSAATDRSPGSPMLSWLAADLASHQQDWTVVIFHHPSYSKGSHDSDTESIMVQMRTFAGPVIEAGGVDLVLTGHSHSYERSMMIDGHYGLSGTFAPSMIVDGGDGDPDGDGAYQKNFLGPVPHSGTVYLAAGNSASLDSAPLDHPIMVRNEMQLGSMILSVDRGVLRVEAIDRFLGQFDTFEIRKPAPPDECSDGLDNDADGFTDFPADPGCANGFGARENPACNDGIDNDGDGSTDFGSDLGCATASHDNESPECQDGIDNDGQIGTDFDGGVSVLGAGNGDPNGADPNCTSASTDSEVRSGYVGCGLGPELAGVLAMLAIARTRRLQSR